MGLLCGLAWATLAVGCTPEAEEPPRPRLQEGATDNAPAENLAAVLHDMAEMLVDESKPANDTLSELRTYIETHKKDVQAAVTEIERASLTLSEEQRSEYVKRHEAQIREAMARFAEAQQAFRARANDAQNVELTDILNTL